MSQQIAYYRGSDMRQRMIPAGLAPDANGQYHWTEVEACRRCGGQGGSRHWPGFTCYECGGGGRMPYQHEAQTEAAAIAAKLAHEKAQARAAARWAKRIAAADAILLPRCGLGWRQLQDIAAWMHDEIALSILWKTAHGKVKKPLPPTDKQLAVLDRLADAPVAQLEREQAAAERKAAEEARLVDLPEARQELRGRFVHAKEQANDFGVTVKGLFLAELADGGLAKVWMSIPRGHYRYEDSAPVVDRDELVALKVTIARSADRGFHYGSRPKVQA